VRDVADWEAERDAVNGAEWDAFCLYAEAERALKPYLGSGKTPPPALASKAQDALYAWDLATAERQKWLAEWARATFEEPLEIDPAPQN
jgi:hypothetical protein